MQSESSVTPSNFAVQSGLHVAIIMDGNGRWAERRGLPRIAGHRAGAAAVRRVVEHALDLGVRRLTLYAFSSDNWRRPAFEHLLVAARLPAAGAPTAQTQRGEA
jgi:undecaprenyl diphosphate synthase